MPDIRPFALLAILLPLAAASTALALPPSPPARLANAAKSLGPLRPPAHLRALTDEGLAAVLAMTPPKKKDLYVHRDLDDIVKDWCGGKVTFYIGHNLAKGDVTFAKTFGLKFFFN